MLDIDLAKMVSETWVGTQLLDTACDAKTLMKQDLDTGDEMVCTPARLSLRYLCLDTP